MGRCFITFNENSLVVFFLNGSNFYFKALGFARVFGQRMRAQKYQKKVVFWQVGQYSMVICRIFLLLTMWRQQNAVQIRVEVWRYALRTQYIMEIKIWCIFFFFCDLLTGSVFDKLMIDILGRQHSGIDDARNIARIAVAMMQKGCILKVNDSLANPIDNNKVYGLNSRRSKTDKTDNNNTTTNENKKSSHSNEGKIRRKDRTENDIDNK